MSDGPLTKLLRGLGLDDKLPVIEAVKRISEKPVSLNPETMFKMARAPELMSDTGIHRLFGDELIRRDQKARAFDIDIEYASFRPEAERWRAIDLNTFDGGPDAPGCFQGYGASEKEARLALLDLFAEYDERPRSVRGRMVNLGNPESPPEFIEDNARDDFEDDINFDMDLEDRNER